MRSGMRGFSRALCVGAVLLVVAGLAGWRMDTASGDQATVSLSGVPASVSAGADFSVQVTVADVANYDGLGGYEWRLVFDPTIIQYKSVVDGPFLGSAGRTVSQCFTEFPTKALDPPDTASVRFGCATGGGSYPDYGAIGPTGSGVLSTVTFTAVGPGSSVLHFDPRRFDLYDGVPDPLSDTYGDAVPSAYNDGSVAVTSGPADTATPGPGDTATPTPGGPTPTPDGPTATATATPVPTGPTPTPTPLPPGYEAVDLAAGCNPVATTYADATPIGTIAGAVGPAGSLEALWEFEGTAWQGYSPAYPEASDLTAKNFLDVVFVCVTGPGAFVRPIV